MKTLRLLALGLVAVGHLALAADNNEDCAKRNQSGRYDNQKAAAERVQASLNGSASTSTQDSGRTNQ